MTGFKNGTKTEKNMDWFHFFKQKKDLPQSTKSFLILKTISNLFIYEESHHYCIVQLLCIIAVTLHQNIPSLKCSKNYNNSNQILILDGDNVWGSSVESLTPQSLKVLNYFRFRHVQRSNLLFRCSWNFEKS